MMATVDLYSGRTKIEFIRRAQDSWLELADWFSLRRDEWSRWLPGEEPRGLWEWLADRGRIGELRAACLDVGRPDLSELLASAERPTEAGSRRPMMVPVVGRVRIPRPGLHQQVIAAFRRGVEPAVAATAAIRGTGGFGKTTLAEMVCADPEVQLAFPGGIVWVEIGNAPEGRIPMKIKEILRELVPGSASELNLRDPGRQLAEALGDQATLLVIDDAWTSGQLRPFLTGAPSCMRLITTRNAGSLPRGTSTVPVEAMLRDEARELLLYNVPAPESEESVDRLLTVTGCWPLLLGLLNGVVDRLVQQGNSADEALAEAELRLRQAGPLDFDPSRPEVRQDAVGTTLRASLDFLPAQERLRFEELAVFPVGGPIPLPLLRRWWGSTAGLDEAKVRRLCALLADQSLVLRYQLNPPQIHLHDVVVEALREMVGTPRLDRMRYQRLALLPPTTMVDLDDDDEA
jgi:hypothetical protein